MRSIFNTDNAPSPIGPYNQACWAGPLLFVSGQVAIDPSTSEVVQGDMAAQSRQVMKNLHAVITDAGLVMSDIVKVTAFVKDMGQYSTFNKIYGEYFSDDNAPAREVVEVSDLPKHVDVEVSAIAYKS